MKNNDALIASLNKLLPRATVKEGGRYPEVIVPAEEWLATAQQLKQHEETPFDYLISLTAVDYKDHFTVVVHLESTKTHDLIVLKTDVTDRDHPQVATLSRVWVTAEFHEREVFDLFGIRFKDHPDLRRFFLEDDYGYPLRKDFKDDINMIQLPN